MRWRHAAAAAADVDDAAVRLIGRLNSCNHCTDWPKNLEHEHDCRLEDLRPADDVTCVSDVSNDLMFIILCRKTFRLLFAISSRLIKDNHILIMRMRKEKNCISHRYPGWLYRMNQKVITLGVVCVYSKSHSLLLTGCTSGCPLTPVSPDGISPHLVDGFE